MSPPTSLWRFANPALFLMSTQKILPLLWTVAIITTALGLGWGFFFTPNDYQQGSSVKIMFIHVPAAMMAINCWVMMLVACLVWFIRRHHVSALAARAAAPVGLIFTLIGLASGALWGAPIWGTYWAWDPRLSSFLILLFFYIGFIALGRATPNPDKAADLCTLLCMVGSVFAFLSRYAVRFWEQGLHQGSSIPVIATGERKIDAVFFYPLILTMVGFFLIFIALVLVRTGNEIRTRQTAMLNTLILEETDA